MDVLLYCPIIVVKTLKLSTINSYGMNIKLPFMLKMSQHGKGAK